MATRRRRRVGLATALALEIGFVAMVVIAVRPALALKFVGQVSHRLSTHTAMFDDLTRDSQAELRTGISPITLSPGGLQGQGSMLRQTPLLPSTPLRVQQAVFPPAAPAREPAWEHRDRQSGQPQRYRPHSPFRLLVADQSFPTQRETEL